MFGINYGGQEPAQQEAPQQQQVDLAAQLKQEREAREALEQQVKDLRNHSLRSTETANQQINLLRGQLTEVVRPQATPATSAAPASDDWMSMLSGGAPAAAPAQGERLMTPSEVRRMIQEEKQREAQAHYQEAAKIEELNSRFMVEYPDLAANPAAIKAIKNQFTAVSNLRPDLPADQRYRLAIDNVQQELLPLLGSNAQDAPRDTKPKEKANPYMPNIFAPPPGQQSLDRRLTGAVDGRSLEDKFSAREKEIKEWQKQRAKMQGR